MKIKDIKRARHDVSPSGFCTLLRFTLEPTDGVIIYDCTVVRAPDGRHLIYGPASRAGAQVLSLAPSVRRNILELMTNEVEFDRDNHIAA